MRRLQKINHSLNNVGVIADAKPAKFNGITLTVIAGLMAVVSTAFLTRDFVTLAWSAIETEDVTTSIQLLTLYVPVYVLLFGAFSYIATRYGHFKRVASDVSRHDDLDQVFDADADVKELLILVPSYKEETSVIRQTLMSAALVEYPAKRIALLIDNPPGAKGAEDQRLLAATRQLVLDLQMHFQRPAERLAQELDGFLRRSREGKFDPAAECERVSGLYLEVAQWFEAQAKRFASTRPQPGNEHVDRFFIDQVLLLPASVNQARAEKVRNAVKTQSELQREYRHLASLFRTTFTFFERKRYVNCSHAPNKAMNLNTYMSLVGKSFKENARIDGRYLTVCDASEPGATHVPPCEYILTIDADSVVRWDYALRLTSIMRAEGNERLAVVQTPYSAYPGAPGLIERVAGATTDIQYLSHQGMTFFDATSWVGANALLRLTALQDIATEIVERGQTFKVYIQDTTLIEDTAATVDLIAKGWRLYNYQSRLAYSATPNDFGALLIQRRRWSNGGLLIFPSLLGYLFVRPFSGARWREMLVRTHYVLSPAIMSVAMLMLTFSSFDDSLFTIWVPMAAIPYQLLYACDLSITGRSWRDLPRVYALNMSLIIVHLGGTIQSIRQAITGRKPAFGRTPKMADRTTTPVLYLVGLYVLTTWCISLWIADIAAGRVYHLLFTALNTGAFVYALTFYVGFRATIQDVWARFQVSASKSAPAVPAPLIALPPPNPAERLTLPRSAWARAQAPAGRTRPLNDNRLERSA